MIDDPRSPDYRYPDVGDRLWHRASRRWLTVAGPPADGAVDGVMATFDPSGDSVTAMVDTLPGGPRLVHLRSLRDVHGDVRTCRHCGCPIKVLPAFGDELWYHADRPFSGSSACDPTANPDTTVWAEPVGYVPIEQRLPRRISRLLERP